MSGHTGGQWTGSHKGTDAQCPRRLSLPMTSSRPEARLARTVYGEADIRTKSVYSGADILMSRQTTLERIRTVYTIKLYTATRSNIRYTAVRNTITKIRRYQYT